MNNELLTSSNMIHCTGEISQPQEISLCTVPESFLGQLTGKCKENMSFNPFLVAFIFFLFYQNFLKTIKLN